MLIYTGLNQNREARTTTYFSQRWLSFEKWRVLPVMRWIKSWIDENTSLCNSLQWSRTLVWKTKTKKQLLTHKYTHNFQPNTFRSCTPGVFNYIYPGAGSIENRNGGGPSRLETQLKKSLIEEPCSTLTKPEAFKRKLG